MANIAWQETTLGAFVRLQRGHDLPEADRRSGDIPVMGSAGPNGVHSVARAKGPGVVIGRSGVGSMGVVSYCETDFWPHNTVLYVTDFLGNDPRFAYYFLRQLNLRQFDSGSAQASLNRNYIYPISIRIPRPDEQRAIAHILGSLDNKIELNRRMNETLEAIARALFKSWFVDFDPVRAKMDGRALNTNDGPMNWPLGSLIDLCELKRGYDLPAAQRSPGRYPIVSSSGISGFHSVPMAQGPGVVTGRYGTIGEVYFINEPYWPLNTALYVRDFKGNCPRFVFYSLQHVDFLQYSDKAAVPGINRNHLHQAPMVLPPRAMQQEFEKLLTPVWTKQDANKAESTTLTSLRDTLLPKLISGELRVEAAEKIVEAVA